MSNIPLPNTYGRIAIDAPQGGIGSVMDPTLAGIKRNLDAISASINQTVTAIQSLDAKDAALDAAISSLKSSVSSLTESVSDAESDIAALEESRDQILGYLHEFVRLDPTGGNTAWNLQDLPGYPYIRAVMVKPNGGDHTLSLPSLGASDRLCVSVKVTHSSDGSLTIESPSATIVSVLGSPGTSHTLSPSFPPSEYAVTLLWAGSDWQIIENAGRFS